MLVKFLAFLLLEPAVSAGLVYASIQLARNLVQNAASNGFRFATVVAAIVMFICGIAIGVHFLMHLSAIVENAK